MPTRTTLDEVQRDLDRLARDINPAHRCERFVEYVTLHTDPSRFGYRMILRRLYNEMSQELDFREILPGWQQFAHARQGIE